MHNLCNRAALQFGHFFGCGAPQPTNPDKLSVATSMGLLQDSGIPDEERIIMPGATAADAYRVSKSFDRACETEADYWSERYLIGSGERPKGMAKADYDACFLFKTRWDTFCTHRTQVRQLQSDNKLDFETASEAYTMLAGSLAVAFGLADPATGQWTEETLRRYFPTGAIYNGPSSTSNLVNQLLKIIASGGSLCAETYGYAHPEARAAVVMAKACINMTYAVAVTAVALYSIKRNAALQSPAVSQVASETSKESWNSAINSSKRIDEDGTPIPMRQTKHVKFDWNAMEKTISLIKEGQASPLDTYSNQLQRRIDQKQLIIQRFKKEKDKKKKISKWKQNEIARLTDHVRFLSDLMVTMKPHRDPYIERSTRKNKINISLEKIDEIRSGLTHDLIVCQTYKQLNTAKNGGKAKAIRNGLNFLYAGLGLTQNICDYLSFKQKSNASAYALEPEPEPQPDSDMSGTDLAAVKLGLGWSALAVAIAQPLAYRYAGTHLVPRDFLAKLATQFKLTALTGLGNSSNEEGLLDPEKIDACVAGPIQVRTKHMITALTPDLMLRAALISYDLTAAKRQNTNTAASPESVPTFDSIYTHLKSLLNFSKEEDIGARLHRIQEYIDETLGDSKKSAELDGWISELKDIATDVDLLETKQLDAFLARDSVPQSTRTIFREALLHGLGISNYADSDRELAAMAGSAEKNSFIGNRLQLAAKLAVALEYYFCGNISPLMISALSKAAVEALHYYYGFDDDDIELVILFIKMSANGIALAGTLLSIGMAFANGPHVEIKNLRRNLLSDQPDIPNAGTLNPGEPGTELLTGPNLSSMRGRIKDFRTIASRPIDPNLLPDHLEFTSEISLRSEFSKQVFAANLQFLSGGFGKVARKYFGYFSAPQGELRVRSKEELDEFLQKAGLEIRIAIDKHLPAAATDTVINVEHALLEDSEEALPNADSSTESVDENRALLNQTFGTIDQSGWKFLGPGNIYFSPVSFINPNGGSDGRGYRFISADHVNAQRQGNKQIKPASVILCYNNPADPAQPFHQRQDAADCTIASVNMMLKRHVEPRFPYGELLTRDKVIRELKRMKEEGEWDEIIEKTQFSAQAMLAVSGELIEQELSSLKVDAKGKISEVRSSRLENQDAIEGWIGAQPSACLTMAYTNNSGGPRYHTVLIEKTGSGLYQVVDAKYNHPTWSCAADNLFNAARMYHQERSHKYPSTEYNVFDLILFNRSAEISGYSTSS